MHQSAAARGTVHLQRAAHAGMASHDGSDSTVGLVLRLLDLLAVPDLTDVLAECMAAHRRGSGSAPAAIDTKALNTVFRALKARTALENRLDFEQAFMALVSRVGAAATTPARRTRALHGRAGPKPWLYLLRIYLTPVVQDNGSFVDIIAIIGAAVGEPAVSLLQPTRAPAAAAYGAGTTAPSPLAAAAAAAASATTAARAAGYRTTTGRGLAGAAGAPSMGASGVSTAPLPASRSTTGVTRSGPVDRAAYGAPAVGAADAADAGSGDASAIDARRRTPAAAPAAAAAAAAGTLAGTHAAGDYGVGGAPGAAALATLLAAAEEGARDPAYSSRSEITSGGRGRTDTTSRQPLHPETLRYGDVIALRSGAVEGGCLSIARVPARLRAASGSGSLGSSDGGSVVVHCLGSGTGAPAELFEIVHASHVSAGGSAAAVGSSASTTAAGAASAASEAALTDRGGRVVHALTLASRAPGAANANPRYAVRCGDAIALRNVATGAFITTAAPSYARPVVPMSFPAWASSEARGVTAATASPAAGSDRGAASGASTSVFIVVSPDALAAMHTRSDSSGAAPERPVLTAGQRLVLIAHSQAAPTHAASVTASSTREAVLKLQALAAAVPSTGPHSRPLAGSGASGSFLPPVSLFVDAIASMVDHASGGLRGHSASATAAATGGGMSAAASLTLQTLCVSPPASCCWVAIATCLRPYGGSAALSGEQTLPSPLASRALQALLPDWCCLRPASIPALRPTYDLQQPLAMPLPVASALVVNAATAPTADSAVVAAAAGGVLPLSTLPPHLRETALVGALLHAFSGFPSAYIGARVQLPSSPSTVASTPDASAAVDVNSGNILAGGALRNVEFFLRENAGGAGAAVTTGPLTDSALTASLLALAQRMLPVARLFVRCSWAVEALGRPACGAVSVALAAAARAILREFSSLVVQLEGVARAAASSSSSAAGAEPVPVGLRPGYSPHVPVHPPLVLTLSLQQLWFYVQPSLRTLTALDALLQEPAVDSDSTSGGGMLLNRLLAAAATTGDDVTRTLAHYLLERAAAPYMTMLSQWLHTGELHDPCGEFMVMAPLPAHAASAPAAAMVAANAWGAAAFRLREARTIPAFLQPHAHAILASGKCMHVLRSCMERQLPHSRSGLASGAAAGSTRTPALTGAAGAASVGTPSKLASSGLHLTARPSPGHRLALPAVSADALDSPAATPAMMLRVLPFAAPIPYAGVDAAAYAPAIARAAAFTSRRLVEVLTAPSGPPVALASSASASAGGPGLGLLSRLQTIKSFFLLARGECGVHAGLRSSRGSDASASSLLPHARRSLAGDYLTHFLDTADAELAKEYRPPSTPGATAGSGSALSASLAAPASALSLHRLKGLLELCVRATSADGDAHKQEVGCRSLGTQSFAGQAALYPGMLCHLSHFHCRSLQRSQTRRSWRKSTP